MPSRCPLCGVEGEALDSSGVCADCEERYCCVECGDYLPHGRGGLCRRCVRMHEQWGIDE